MLVALILSFRPSLVWLLGAGLSAHFALGALLTNPVLGGAAFTAGKAAGSSGLGPLGFHLPVLIKDVGEALQRLLPAGLGVGGAGASSGGGSSAGAGWVQGMVLAAREWAAEKGVSWVVGVVVCAALILLLARLPDEGATAAGS